MRQYSFADRCILALDSAVAGVFGAAPTGARPYPASAGEAEMSDAERRHSAGLMRVNHAGEIAAQGLYFGQAVSAREGAVAAQMYQAANEENDHLAWCQRRLEELHSHPSKLAPLWFCGSLAIGAAAGAAGDRWSLGFIAETEKQVVEHLEGHFEALPPNDRRSREIVAQMRRDEARHAADAVAAGAHPLPTPLRSLMKFTAGIMTSTAYYA